MADRDELIEAVADLVERHGKRLAPPTWRRLHRLSGRPQVLCKELSEVDESAVAPANEEE